MGIIDGNPSPGVRVDGHQLLQGVIGPAVLGHLGLVFQQVAGKECALVDHVAVPEGIAAVGEHGDDDDGRHQAEDGVS